MRKWIFAVLLMLIGCLIAILPQKDEEKGVATELSDAGRRLSCRYYDEAGFKISIEGGAGENLPEGKIMGGIVPHHLLAGRMIGDFFKKVSQSDPEVVVVIGPNHKGEGAKSVQTAGWDWSTPFGVLQADGEIVGSLLENRMAAENSLLMEREHSISSLVPYIKYFMPHSKIVPILMTGTDRISEAERLGEFLARMARGRKILFIASVDFSHYLPVEKADEMDEITEKALLERDIDRIRAMDNDYMDSPVSIITLLTVMDRLSAGGQLILDHNNSARIKSADSNSTTSYFTAIYYTPTR